jgi:formiminotetrahydrofolate cyclodeaminase
MNISEFERVKPMETMKELNRLIKKYSSLSNEEIMDDTDAATASLAQVVKDDLLKFKILFKSGA